MVVCGGVTEIVILTVYRTIVWMSQSVGASDFVSLLLPSSVASHARTRVPAHRSTQSQSAGHFSNWNIVTKREGEEEDHCEFPPLYLVLL